jgi:hypothetical protein
LTSFDAQKNRKPKEQYDSGEDKKHHQRPKTEKGDV